MMMMMQLNEHLPKYRLTRYYSFMASTAGGGLGGEHVDEGMTLWMSTGPVLPGDRGGSYIEALLTDNIKGYLFQLRCLCRRVVRHRRVRRCQSPLSLERRVL